MAYSTRAIISRYAMWRHIANTIAATTTALTIAAFSSWVLINWIVGCGEIDPYTRTANTEVCFMHPANWR